MTDMAAGRFVRPARCRMTRPLGPAAILSHWRRGRALNSVAASRSVLTVRDTPIPISTRSGGTGERTSCHSHPR